MPANRIVAALLAIVTLSLNGTLALAEQKAPSQNEVKAITEISLTYVQNFWLLPQAVDTMTLRDDGTAVYIGAQDLKHTIRYKGMLFIPWREQVDLPSEIIDTMMDHDTPFNSFTGLAQLLIVNDFFSLKDKYGAGPHDGFYDGTNVILSAVRNGRRKAVSNSQEDGSITLWGLEQAILGATRNIKWEKVADVPDPTTKTSGIRGVAMQSPVNGGPEREGQANQRPLPKAIITVQPQGGGAELTRTVADENGKFVMPLAAGKYLIVPLAPNPGAKLPRGAPKQVTVAADQYTDVVVEYDTGIR